jgi:hypothetical protein
VIGNRGSIGAVEAAGLNPGIWKALQPVVAEQQDATSRGYSASLVFGQKLQRLQIALCKPAYRRERL